MRDPVPAIIEASATGEIAEIFSDIRRVLGVDVVNLIWRHLATIDGALAWTWSTLRPVYEDGTIAAEAAALHAALDLPALPGFPPKPSWLSAFVETTSAPFVTPWPRMTGQTRWH